MIFAPKSSPGTRDLPPPMTWSIGHKIVKMEMVNDRSLEPNSTDAPYRPAKTLADGAARFAIMCDE
jgi:hypothetical protein